MQQHQYQGLTTQQAEARILEDGYNSLPEASSPGFWLLFLRQFKSPFIYVLLIAALVSFLLSQTINGLFIFAVLLLNATIGSFQEYSAEKAARALNAMVPQLANVIREGHTQKIDSKYLVNEDIVYLTSGDRVPADGICLQTDQLTLDESMLTGESQAVVKTTTQQKITTLNRCFAGTNVIKGRGFVKITATGSQTELGKIASAVNKEATTKPPLMQRIEKFTLRVTIATMIIISLIFMIALLRGEQLDQVFFLGVALAVSAIPEGLPAAITVALAIGMRRMAKANVIVRKLLAVESLGSCTYIASDKTGTLTVNDMTIQRVAFADGQTINISGEGIDFHGGIDKDLSPADIEKLNHLATIGTLANESELYFHQGQWHAEGDQVDIAFLVLINKLGIPHLQLQQRYPEINRIPYESENAFSASLNRFNSHFIFSVKGSAERLVTMCQLNTIESETILNQVNQLASQGFRILALAKKTLTTIPDNIEKELDQLTFIGIVGIIDPLRTEAVDAVAQCHQANIEVAMITGDHPETAGAIARQLGIMKNKEAVITGKNIFDCSTDQTCQISSLVKENHVFARIKPIEKQLIVEQLQKQGHFVAVTGDGVNDAPALKTAHVGIAMGKRGTDVARESADLIITDDNFSSIVKGIIEGRVVYANIRKVVFLLISTGAAEIFLFILSLLAGLPLPLFPIQLLWLNLVTNGVQDVALAFEPAEGNELKRPPRRPTESIFNRLMLERVIINAIVMGAIAFSLFAFQLEQGASESEARNMTLLLMVLFENVHALNSRSETISLFKLPFFGNPLLLLGILIAQGIHIGAMHIPVLSNLLQLTPVSLENWFNLMGIALILIIVDESQKWWHRRKQYH